MQVKEDQDYINFRTAIWVSNGSPVRMHVVRLINQEVNHEGTAGPPTTAYLPREDEDGSDDEEIEVGMQTQNFRCPITLRPYVNAVTWWASRCPAIQVIESDDRSVDCKHSYSKDAIMSILSNGRKRSVKCPFSGCNTAVTATKLQVRGTLDTRRKSLKPSRTRNCSERRMHLYDDRRREKREKRKMMRISEGWVGAQ